MNESGQCPGNEVRWCSENEVEKNAAARALVK